MYIPRHFAVEDEAADKVEFLRPEDKK